VGQLVLRALQAAQEDFGLAVGLAYSSLLPSQPLPGRGAADGTAGREDLDLFCLPCWPSLTSSCPALAVTAPVFCTLT
jgi:hypothetical protein